MVQVPPATSKGKGRQRDILEATAILGEISSFLCSISKDQKNVDMGSIFLDSHLLLSCFLTVVFNFLMFTDFFILCVLLRFFFLQQGNCKYAVIVKCADFVFLSTLGHLFTPSSLEAGLSRCNCFSLAHYSVSIMASSRDTTWSTVLNTQRIGAPTSDLHQVITAAGFPRSNLQAICQRFELHPNLHWTCESDQLWWKSTWKLPAGPNKTTECAVTFILARKPPLKDYDVGYWNTVSSHQPCFSDATWAGMCNCSARCPLNSGPVHGKLWLSLSAREVCTQCSHSDWQSAKPQHKWGFRDKGFFFLV